MSTIIRNKLSGIILSSLCIFSSALQGQDSIPANVIEKNAVTGIEEAMTGTLPGLYSAKNGGQAFGARNFEFYIRGKATVATTSPLILVDDVEGNIDLLDFNEIESVTVLKDAVSLAIYGMRGANGVILVRTKRGEKDKNSIRLNLYTGIQTPVNIQSRLNAYDYTSMYNEALQNDGSSPVYNSGAYQNNPDPYVYPDADYAGMFLKNRSFIQHYNFEARGGNDIARYYALAGYAKQDGLFSLPDGAEGIHNKSYERFNFRTNIDVDLGAGFYMNADVMAAFDYNRSPWISSSYNANQSSDYLFNTILNTPANAFPVWNEDGSIGGTSVYRDNPLRLLKRGSRIDEHKLLTAKVKLGKKLDFITPGLSAFVMYHFENYNASYIAKYKDYAVYELNPSDNTYNKYGSDDTKTTTTGGETSGYYRDQNVHAGLTYVRDINDHALNGMLYYNHTISNVSGDAPDYKYQAISGNITYGFRKRYFAAFSAAVQGSNSFARGKRTGFFPAGGLSWIASEEEFLSGQSIIDLLKIKASYGMSGNDQISGSRFAYRQYWYAGSGYGFGNPNTASDGSYEGALNNPDASWEKAYKTDIGFDLCMLDNSVTVSAGFFRELRKDIMVEQSNVVPSLIGIDLPYFNGGAIENKGIEASIGYSKTFGEFGLNIGANFLYAKNKIIDLKETPYEYAWLFREGNSIDTRYGFAAEGIYNTGEDLTGAPASAYKTVGTGDIRYVNQNPEDDQVINELDKIAIGNAFPDITYGLNFGLTYRNFDLSCYGRGAALYDIYVRPSSFSTYARDNRWQEAASSGKYPKLSISDTHNTQTSTFWQEKGDYFKIQSVEAGYTLSEKITRVLKISEARLSIHANNLFSFSAEREGRDPEALLAGFSQYPLLRSYTIGLSVKL